MPQNSTAYCYDPDTKVFLGSETAFIDPIDKNPLLPAYATFTAPPTIPSGQQAVYVPASGETADSWTLEAIPAAPGSPAPVATNTPADQIAALKLSLAAIDPFLPRSLEDFWAVTKFDTTTLPQQTQQRLQSKVQLRAQIAALESSEAAATAAPTT